MDTKGTHATERESGDEPQILPVDACERLQLALEAGAIVGTWVWDISKNCVTADERFARTFDLSPARCARGIPIEEAFTSIHPEDRVHLAEAIDDAMVRGGAFRCEYRVKRPDEGYCWIEANGRAQHDDNGIAVRFPGVLIDIESRKAAEAERDRASALLRAFTTAVPGVVYAKDRDGRLLIANDGATRLIGKSPEFYLGKTDLEILEDKAQALKVMETDRRIMHSAMAEQIEERVDMPDGSEAIWLSVKAPMFNAAGEVIGLIGSSIDVTARKNAEAALLELNQNLEAKVAEAIAEREAAQAALYQLQKMEVVGQLTGGIAHDFNNLLAGIVGSLDLIKVRLSKGRTTDLERYLSVAYGAAQRAAALTHRLLAFSRRQTLLPQVTHVNRLIGGMEELICRTVGPLIRLQVDLSATSDLCLVDPGQMENALLNLCVNARDALPAGGTIAIETSNVTLVEGSGLDPDLKPGTFLSIRVVDDGIGMSEETLAKACEPFFTTKPTGACTGLGLSMIYGFAKQSNGQMKIESALGKGTRVYLQLPNCAEPMKAPPANAITSAVPHVCEGETVLVVDDEPSVRMFVSEVLGSLGYVVVEAADSQVGLQLLCSDTRVDLLVTDIGLPGGLDGREMAEKARLRRPGLPVLFMTGYVEPQILKEYPPGPAMAVITKPFSLDTFRVSLYAILQEALTMAKAP